MARARNIKPGFFKNYDLADQGPVCQMLFAGLWCLADREGRLEDKPRFIKAELFPYYDVDINGELTKLERLGFVERYMVDGQSYIAVKNFKKHQSPHSTEKKSELPAPPLSNPANPATTQVSLDNGGLTVDSRNHNGGNPPDSLIPDSLIADSVAVADKPNPQSIEKPAAAGDDSEFCRQVIAQYTEHWLTNPPLTLPLIRKILILAEQYPSAKVVSWWGDYFHAARLDDFLNGTTSRNGWVADLNYLLKDETFARVIEASQREAANV